MVIFDALLEGIHIIGETIEAVTNKIRGRRT